jgi:4-amino-4-deoxy-L-arabinose transferase-like glycosyltransferase
MGKNTSREFTKFLRYLSLSVSILFVLVYLILVYFRINYPFELEWMEGCSVDHVIRILSGQKLYVAPSLEFVPFIYTPVYFYVSAALSKIIGTGFLSLRLVSFISSLGCFLVIFLIVKKETKSSFWGILAAGLFAATYRIGGAWFDIARSDSLFLLFLLAGLYLIKFKKSSVWYLLAGVLVSLSFLTKQTALFISIPIMLYCLLLNRREWIYFVGSVVLIIGISTFLLNRIHDGWYNYYVFDLPRQHSLVKYMLVEFWTRDLISKLPIACILSLFYLYALLKNTNKRNFLFYLLMPVGMLGGAWFSRLHQGGYDNVLFPAYAALSILFGLGAFKVFEFIQAVSLNKRRLIEISFYLIFIIQFLLLTYNPRAQIPTENDLDAGYVLIEIMAQLPGDIIVPYHSYLPTLAGKKSYAHHQAISDVIRGDDSPAKTRLLEEINLAITSKKFNALILDAPWFPELTERYYEKQKKVFGNANVFWTVTGMRTTPQVIYVPRTNDDH